MIWFDFVTPKSVLFFKPILDELKDRGERVLCTARACEGYTEIRDLLNLLKIDYTEIGIFGGAELKDKLTASIERQEALLKFISDYPIKKLVCLCSVDANRIAFGLKIPVINFYDIPLSDHKANFERALPQARLTLPLSSKAFKPFVVPDEIFLRFSLNQEQIFSYDFIDPLIWLKGFKPDFTYVKELFLKYGIDSSKPYILIREEEYKSSYVSGKYPFLYESLNDIKTITGANLIIIPRYESSYLKHEFPDVFVLEEKVVIQHLLAFAHLFIGGGGTINTEACFFGTPTISTRSFICHYDKYQIDSGLMHWVSGSEDLMKTASSIFGKRTDRLAASVFSEMNVNTKQIVDGILDQQ